MESYAPLQEVSLSRETSFFVVLVACWVMLSRTENLDFGLRQNKIELARTKFGDFGLGYNRNNHPALPPPFYHKCYRQIAANLTVNFCGNIW
jgi:hypothetical protein